MYFTTTAQIKTIVETLVKEIRRGGSPKESVTTLSEKKIRYAKRLDFEIWYAIAFIASRWRRHWYQGEIGSDSSRNPFDSGDLTGRVAVL